MNKAGGRHERADYIEERLQAEKGKVCTECEHGFFPPAGHGTCVHPNRMVVEIDDLTPACDLFEQANEWGD